MSAYIITHTSGPKNYCIAGKTMMPRYNILQHPMKYLLNSVSNLQLTPFKVHLHRKTTFCLKISFKRLYSKYQIVQSLKQSLVYVNREMFQRWQSQTGTYSCYLTSLVQCNNVKDDFTGTGTITYRQSCIRYMAAAATKLSLPSISLHHHVWCM